MIRHTEIVPFVAGYFVRLQILYNFGIRIAMQTSGTGMFLLLLLGEGWWPVIIGHAIIFGHVKFWYILLGQGTEMCPSRLAQMLKKDKVVVVGGGGCSIGW